MLRINRFVLLGGAGLFVAIGIWALAEERSTLGLTSFAISAAAAVSAMVTAWIGRSRTFGMQGARRRLELNVPPFRALAAAEEALRSFCPEGQMEIEKEELGGRAAVRTTRSATSWGERVEVDVAPNGMGSVVIVTSVPIQRQLTGTWRHSANVQEVVALIERLTEDDREDA